MTHAELQHLLDLADRASRIREPRWLTMVTKEAREDALEAECELREAFLAQAHEILGLAVVGLTALP